MQKFGYHTHTSFSDGKNSVEEIVGQAAFLGFEEIGISDHLIVHKNIKQTPSWENIKECGACQTFQEKIDLCHKHAEEIRKAGQKFNIKTLVGYEVDYFIYNGWEDELRDFIKKIDHDYLISGNHFFMNESGEDLFDIWCFNKEEVAPENIKIYINRHFKTIQKALKSELFVFLAHLDYVQKANTYKESDNIKEIDEIVQILSETKTGCEISTKGLRKFGHFYPSENILKKIIQKNIPIIISDDAHNTSELGSCFDDAENMLQKLNCNNRFKIK